MGKPTGFKEFQRELPGYRPVEERIQHWNEFTLNFPEEKIRTQGARCMDCGIPFCHFGCPLGNIIPEWNDLVYKGRWEDAIKTLLKTNNFPEFTGRICPAPCEESCTLNIPQTPVTIKQIEVSIIDHAFAKGWIKPVPPSVRTGKKVAVIGSGPAGLACAAQLNRAGHWVTVFERANRIGGLLMYGIPNFKLEKSIVDRRVKILESEGVKFEVNANVGFNISVEKIRHEFDAICLCGGSTLGRDLTIPGRHLKGVYLAMEYLPMQTKKVLGDQISMDQYIHAKGKNVVVLGGGDTGSDCVGTSVRLGAKSVLQFELLPKPPEKRTVDMPWPRWPTILRTSTSHHEGCERDWSINTKEFLGEDGVLKKIRVARVDWTKGTDGRMQMKEIPGSEFEVEADLCFMALGFVHPEHKGPIEQLNLQLDERKNVKTDANYMTSLPGVFSAGDMRRGQSLVVWAIHEGRQAAKSVDAFLMGRSNLV